MKKAKLMLAVIACMTVIGGAYAFKASRTQFTIYTGPLNGKVCTFTLHTATIASGLANVAASTTYLSTGCPNARTVVTLN